MGNVVKTNQIEETYKLKLELDVDHPRKDPNSYRWVINYERDDVKFRIYVLFRYKNNIDEFCKVLMSGGDTNKVEFVYYIKIEESHWAYNEWIHLDTVHCYPMGSDIQW
jgi:hypothetical protein